MEKRYSEVHGEHNDSDNAIDVKKNVDDVITPLMERRFFHESENTSCHWIFEMSLYTFVLQLRQGRSVHAEKSCWSQAQMKEEGIKGKRFL